jgi:uncharacterized membrane protein YgdD (TMEM256/DUF423 family)
LLTLASSLFDAKLSILGLVTPFGGLSLFAGWFMLLLAVPDSKNDKT